MRSLKLFVIVLSLALLVAACGGAPASRSDRGAGGRDTPPARGGGQRWLG